MLAKTTSENSHPGEAFMMNLLRKRPRLLFGIMVLLLSLSAGLSFVDPGADREKPQPDWHSTGGFRQGYDGMMQGVQSLGTMWSLQKEVSELLAKDQLSAADSLQLLNALKRLEYLNQNLNPH